MKLYAILTTLLVTLSGCGGGSSSGGMDGDNDLSRFDGVYRGMSETVANALGQNITVTGAITVTIENGSVIYLDEDGQRFEVPIDSNGRFSDSNSDSGIISSGGAIESCQGTAVLDGVVTPPTVNGTIEGTGTCVIEGQTQSVTYTNTFNATR